MGEQTDSPGIWKESKLTNRVFMGDWDNAQYKAFYSGGEVLGSDHDRTPVLRLQLSMVMDFPKPNLMDPCIIWHFNTKSKRLQFFLFPGSDCETRL